MRAGNLRTAFRRLITSFVGVIFTDNIFIDPFSAVLGSPPDDMTCNVTTPNSVRLRWTDLNANNLMNDYIQGYVLTYSKVVPPDDLISKLIRVECTSLTTSNPLCLNADNKIQAPLDV